MAKISYKASAKKRKDYRRIDKDPVIDLIRTGIQISGRAIADVATCAGLHPTTINNWLYKDVRRPQNITVELCLTELGIVRTACWIKSGEPVFVDSKKAHLKVVKAINSVFSKGST